MQDQPIKSTFLKFGLYLGLARVIWQLLFYTFGIHTMIQYNWIGSLVTLVLVSVFVVLGIKDYRSLNEGFVSFGKAFLTGLMIALVGGVILYAFNYIYVQFIDPNVTQDIMDATRDYMLERVPDMSEEAYDAAMESNPFAKLGQNPIFGTLIGMLLAAPFTGALVSLISAAVLKKERPTTGL